MTTSRNKVLIRRWWPFVRVAGGFTIVLVLILIVALAVASLTAREVAIAKDISPPMPALIGGALLGLLIAAWRRRMLPELLVALIAAALIARLLAPAVPAVLEVARIGTTPEGGEEPKTEVALPRASITALGEIKSGDVTVVIVQRHRGPNGEQSLETTRYAATLKSEFSPDADTVVLVKRGDDAAAVAPLLEDLADAARIYLVNR